MPSSLLLRPLNPQTERHLFEQAYNWRRHPRRSRMSFEDFAKDDPSQIVLGLFNGELLAVYLFCQVSPTEFEGHFSSSRKAKREDVLAGARQMVEWFSQNGLAILAHVSLRNTPVARFVEDCGFTLTKVLHPDTNSDSVSPNRETFAEYRSKVNGHSAFGKQAEIAGYDSNERVV